MPDYCCNYISLEGDVKQVKKLAERLTDTYDKFNYLNGWCDYVLKIRDDFNYIKEEDKRDSYHYGSRLFDFEFEVEGDSIYISGDSAWSPMFEFTRALCEAYNLIGRIEYEDRASDLGGYVSYDRLGGIDANEEFCFNEWIYREDLDRWIEELIQDFYDLSDERLFLELGDASTYATIDDVLLLEKEFNYRLELNKQ